MPPSVTNKLRELANAEDLETALQLAQELWDLIHGLIPGFPPCIFTGMSFIELQNWGSNTCMAIDWDTAVGDGG